MGLREMAEADLERMRQQYVPPRPVREVAAEGLGLVTFCGLVPFGQMVHE